MSLATPIMAPTTAELILQLFRDGFDTVEIARHLGLPESKASRYLWAARSWEKGLPAEYMHRDVVRSIEP